MNVFAQAHPWLTCSTIIIAGYLFAKGAQTICRTLLIARMFSRKVIFFDSGQHPMTAEHEAACNVCQKEKRN